MPRRCWAERLGDCRGRISAEHLASRSLFPNNQFIDVSGFPWCRGGKVRVALASLTSNSIHMGSLEEEERLDVGLFELYGSKFLFCLIRTPVPSSLETMDTAPEDWRACKIRRANGIGYRIGCLRVNYRTLPTPRERT
jgi:hypothetical protein